MKQVSIPGRHVHRTPGGGGREIVKLLRASSSPVTMPGGSRGLVGGPGDATSIPGGSRSIVEIPGGS